MTMRAQNRFPVYVFSVRFVLFLVVGASVPVVSARQVGIAATAAFNAPGCSNQQLGGITFSAFGKSITVPSPLRGNPEWKAIILDSGQPPNLQPPTILEGFVSPGASNQTSNDYQATAEVAEEDLPWTHYSHDYTVRVTPDPNYQKLLSYQANPDGTTTLHTDMEVEWDNASLMDEKEGFQRTWGAVPEFVWPAVGDRVWVSGRWIFDCGHPGSADTQFVKFSSEIHPPRALVTFRLNHTALDSFPFARTSAPNFPFPQSYLPVTGLPATPFNNGPTNVPVTEADIFISVNGGPANDLCSIVSAPCSGHTGPIIPVNDRNYVFDIYPPITDYGFPEANGTFKVFPPVADASLQWRVEDHFSELPAHACGGTDNTVCVTVDPKICLIDSSTPPPDQTETGCPAVPAHPTRLRVILPFAGTNANFFAKSILVGWDDVPDPAGHATPIVRTFQVRLHDLTVKDNGSGSFNDSDWRVIVNVGGQWRYISPLFDTDANNGNGIFQFNGGSNVCHGDALTDNGNGDCFGFDNTPWTVSVEDGTPIHVAVGGFVARGVEDSGSSLFFCRTYPGGCATPVFSILADPFLDFPFDNDDRIGTYEFDLVAPNYAAPNPFTTAQFGCSVLSATGCSLRYYVAFSVQEVPAATAPASAPLVIGLPSFSGPAGIYFASSTPMIPQTADANTEGFQYRFHRQGAPLPTYATTPFPVHWTHVDLAPGIHSAEVRVGGANSGDGPYDFQYSAESFGNLLEPRHTATFILDTTPPVISIAQPQGTAYPHCGVLTLTYSVDDGIGSGVASFTPTMDGATTLTGVPNLLSGQPINLLTALKLGTHTFSITATDHVNNTDSSSVTFTIIVTPDSIKCDVTQFVAAGKITVDSGNSLLGLLDAAAQARAAGNCATANKIYQAFITQVTALSGKKIDPTAAQIMILDAQYLIAHCP
jgi:hypothetical protein